MNVENEFPKRKDLRLKQYDYSAGGAYLVTICIKNRMRLLSQISKSVGGGAHDDPQVRLKEIGKVIEKYLLSSENIPGVKIDRYVIMPDHIHAIIFLYPKEYANPNVGSSKAPTPTNKMLPHIVSTFKRFCGKDLGGNIFQRGYIEHIIRDLEDYKTRAKYIIENPKRWYYNELRSKE